MSFVHPRFRSLSFALVAGISLVSAGFGAPLVSLSADGRVETAPWSDRGDRLLDWSHCGYRAGGVALPKGTVKKILSPTGSDDESGVVQAALDEIGSLSPDANGHRGVLLLKKGTWRIGKPLRIASSGTVLRGEGQGEDGTVLIATLRKQHDLLTVGAGTVRRSKGEEDEAGGAGASVEGGISLADEYVPYGASRLRMASGGFKVGDRVEIVRPGTAAWIQALGMDRIPVSSKKGGGATATVQWTPERYTLTFERTVVGVEGDAIVLDVPLPQSFASEFGGGVVKRVAAPKRVTECGVENLRLDSEYDASVRESSPVDHESDENHGWTAISFAGAEDGWVRDVTAIHFGYALASIERSSRRITVQDSTCLDPVSKITGGRRYSFKFTGGQNLVIRCKARHGRHDFVVDSTVAGPNAFVDCDATECHAGSETHHRWGMGTLYDNVKVEGPDAALMSCNRGNMGSGHGWSGNMTLFYRCEAPLIFAMAPPTGMNFIIAPRGPGQPVSAQARRILPYQNASGVKVEAEEGPAQGTAWKELDDAPRPRSLYLAQLANRLGGKAVEAVTESWQR